MADPFGFGAEYGAAEYGDAEYGELGGAGPLPPPTSTRDVDIPVAVDDAAPTTRSVSIPVAVGLDSEFLLVVFNVLERLEQPLPVQFTVVSGGLSAALPVQFSVVGTIEPLPVTFRVIPNLLPLFSADVQMPFGEVEETGL